MRMLLGALALLMLQPALAATETPASSAPDVAEMLQRRHASQLREQFAKESRWDEIRRLDEEQVRRQQVSRKQTITRLNAELAREGSVDTAVNGDGVFSICAPVRVPAKVKADANGTDTSSVR